MQQVNGLQAADYLNIKNRREDKQVVRVEKRTRGTSKKTSNGISTSSLRMPRFPLALLAWARPVTLRSFVAVSEFLRFLPRVGFAEVDGTSLSMYMDSSSVVSRYEVRSKFPMVVQWRSVVEC